MCLCLEHIRGSHLRKVPPFPHTLLSTHSSFVSGSVQSLWNRKALWKVYFVLMNQYAVTLNQVSDVNSEVRATESLIMMRAYICTSKRSQICARHFVLARSAHFYTHFYTRIMRHVVRLTYITTTVIWVWSKDETDKVQSFLYSIRLYFPNVRHFYAYSYNHFFNFKDPHLQKAISFVWHIYGNIFFISAIRYRQTRICLFAWWAFTTLPRIRKRSLWMIGNKHGIRRLIETLEFPRKRNNIPQKSFTHKLCFSCRFLKLFADGRQQMYQRWIFIDKNVNSSIRLKVSLYIYLLFLIRTLSVIIFFFDDDTFHWIWFSQCLCYIL